MAYFGITATDAGLQAAAGGDVAGGLARQLARVRRGVPVVILVHGYKFHPGVPAANPHRSLYAFRPQPGNRRIRSWPAGLGIADDDGETGLAIGFAWPAAEPHLPSLVATARTGFALVYDRAAEVGTQLAALIRLVQRLAPGRAIDVLAHSLGARVALAALPHLERSPERMILMGAAELEARVHEFLAASRPGVMPDIYNVTARANDVYDLALECFAPRRGWGERAIGVGLRTPRPHWIDLQLDRAEVTAWINAQGIPLTPGDARICHWGFYTRDGALAVYQAILTRRPGWDIASLRAAPCFAAQEPRWSRVLPRRRLAMPALDAPLGAVAYE